MPKTFRAITLSYKTAPIVVREAVSLNDDNSRKLLELVKSFIPATEILIVSTCNRTEVYYSSEKDCSDELIKLIAIEKGNIKPEEISNYFEVINDQRKAIEHLFNVSLGLESQVIGDIQISNQVKRAYQIAADADTAGPFLHRLMHTIFAASKRVQQETCFRDGAASVSYATVELTKEMVQEITQPTVLVIGVGEIGSDVVKNLVKSESVKIKIANRTKEKAVALADGRNLEVVDWENIAIEIQNADVIISAVPGLQQFFAKQEIAKLHIPYQKVLIDLSIPRSIDPLVSQIQGVHLFNVDHIRNKTSETLERRKSAIVDVKRIVNEMSNSFEDWTKEAEITSVISDLKDALEQIRQQEMKRYLKDVDQNDAEKIDTITKSIIQKIVKLPVVQLKTACQRGNAEQLSDVLKVLFNLEKDNQNIRKATYNQ